MKNKILLSLSLFISSISFAQTPLAFGIKAGVVSSGMRGEALASLNNLLDYSGEMIKTKNHTGFFAGFHTNVPITNNFSIEPGLYYSQKGYELQGNFNIKGLEFLGANPKAVLQSQYLEIPVLLKAHLGGFQLFAGPQVSYLINANLKTSAGVLGISLLHKKMNATNQLNRWDASVTGGVGYQFLNGVTLSASYDYGLMKADANEILNAYNRALKIGIGINF